MLESQAILTIRYFLGQALSLLVNFLRHEFFPSHINGGAARPLTERSDVGDGCDASIQRWLSLDPCFRSRDSNAGRNSMSTERLV